jgi:hypothetical protein
MNQKIRRQLTVFIRSVNIKPEAEEYVIVRVSSFRRSIWSRVMRLKSLLLIVSVVVCSPIHLHALTKPKKSATAIKPNLYFEPNLGQFSEDVLFVGRGVGTQTLITRDSIVLILEKSEEDSSELNAARDSRGLRSRRSGRNQNVERSIIRMRFAGGSKDLAIRTIEKTSGVSNYLIGNDSSKWYRGVPHYSRLEFAEVYPGIDLVIRGRGREMEYDFVIAPGFDPDQIELELEGNQDAVLTPEGDLLIKAPHGEIKHHRPIAHQQQEGRAVDVSCLSRKMTATQAVINTAERSCHEQEEPTPYHA